jgi:hypothetical protein
VPLGNVACVSIKQPFAEISLMRPLLLVRDFSSITSAEAVNWCR